MSAELGQFAKVQGGFAFKSKDFGSEGLPVIKIANVTGGGFVDLSSYECIQPDLYPRIGQFLTEPDDVLIAMTGANVGKVVRVGRDQPQCAINQRVGRLQLKDHCEYSKDFFYYLTSSLAGYQHFVGAAYGSAQPNISGALIEKLQVPDIPPSIANQAAGFLRKIDDKIQLNYLVNQTLEQIAQAIFKSWFVDFEPTRAKIIAKEQGADLATQELAAQAIICGVITLEQLEEIEQNLETTLQHAINEKLTQDNQAPIKAEQLKATAALFPNELVESGMTYIPQGWNIGKMQDCCERVESGGTPKRSEEAYWNGDIKWLSSGEVRDVIILDTKEKITKLGLEKSSAKLWPQGATVVAMYGATAGQICLLANEMTANQACCALVPKENYESYVFLAARRSIEDLAGKASGSAQQNLNKTLVSEHEILLPPLFLLERFEQVASSLIDKWICNFNESVELSEVRNVLLPKLLSGELKVNKDIF